MTCLMIDIEGFELKSADIRRIRHPLVGGVILFSRNFDGQDQLNDLILAVREIRKDFLIAVDHEGGRVQRFRETFTALPDMNFIGQIFDQDKSKANKIARSVGWVIAKELGAVGIDFSFTPVLDINYGASSIIGNRSFHSNIEPIINLSAALHEGLNYGGMQGVGKHFPGHGYIKADTHLETAIDSRLFDEIRNSDMRVFESLIKVGLFGVMPSHVIYSACDSRPSGLSSFWLQEQLRESLGFNGAIFSDDMSMNAAVLCSDNITDRVLMALNAGCDMVLVCNSPNDVDSLLDNLDWNVRQNSVSRLLNMKLNFEKNKVTIYDGSSLKEVQVFIKNITK